MPILNIEHPRLRREIRDVLKRHILHERRRKKEEADTSKADKQRRRAEKAQALSSSKVQLEDNAKDILQLERTLAVLAQQKLEQYNLLKRVLMDEDRRKHSAQALTKEPSWTYTNHPQHYLSTQQSHRLLSYKPPLPPPSQSQSFIPTTISTSLTSKRPCSPASSGYIYSSPSKKFSHSTHASQIQSNPTSPSSAYSSSSSQLVTHNGAPAFPSPQNQSVFSIPLNYSPSISSSAAANTPAFYSSQIPRVRLPSQLSNYSNPLFLLQPIVNSKQRTENVCSHHPMLMPSKNESIMNGYPLWSQQ